MSDLREEPRAIDALREQLGALPVPELSADFNTRVIDAIGDPVSWLHVAWPQLRIVMGGACCSAAATLLLLYLVVMAPLPGPRASSAAGPTSAAASSAAFERMLRSAGLTPADLALPDNRPAAPVRAPRDRGSSIDTRPITRREPPDKRCVRLTA